MNSYKRKAGFQTLALTSMCLMSQGYISIDAKAGIDFKAPKESGENTC